ncbi:MAG: hypothetical protein ABI240_14430 [Sphingomonas sp.]
MENLSAYRLCLGYKVLVLLSKQKLPDDSLDKSGCCLFDDGKCRCASIRAAFPQCGREIVRAKMFTHRRQVKHVSRLKAGPAEKHLLGNDLSRCLHIDHMAADL